MESIKNILSKIYELADNDKEYLLELKQLYHNFFTNLIIQYDELLRNQKTKDLSLLIHKIKPAMQYICLKDLEKLLNDGILMLKNANHSPEKINENIQKVVWICEGSLIEVNKI